ncbi:MAG: Bax inhibitor-1/YccA family protein, partial [Anaeroplasmataceae bacterium]|nr:Bax inhibitor-1/YccA family protein [Anaeroplasmataceae bacterium]
MKQSPLFSNIQTGEAVYDDVDRATYKGITIKTVILLLISVLIAAVIAFALPTILTNNPTTFYVTLIVSSIVGFISVIVGRTSERKAKYASVIYAICEGLFLGSISAIVEAYVPGVVATAVFSTIVLFAVMLTLFATGVIRVGSKFRSICFGLTLGAIAIILMVSLFSLFIDYQTYFGIMIGVEVFLVFYGVITL